MSILRAVRQSLRTKIVLIVLGTTFVALSISTFALLTYDIESYAGLLVSDVTTQADILAKINAPTLEFDDPVTAETNLELLSSRPAIVAAAIYTPDGQLFATYSRSPATDFPPLGTLGAHVEGTTLTLFHPIVQNDDLLGTVYLESRYDLMARLQAYLLILLAVMAASLFVAGLISLALAASVTGPVRSITQVARQVIERRDFTLRARRTTEDEIGVLVDAVNTMLAEVGQRAEALEESNRALQQETDERRLAESALRVADQHKNEFLATLAHELRNPLAPMVNAIGLLKAPNADASHTQAHSILERQLTQMVRLVDDLLDVSRITSGKLAVRKQPVELATIVQSAVDTARPLFDERHHSLLIELPSQPVYLHADAVRLAQVFSNLLNNAAKYSEYARKVSLTAVVDGSDLRVRIDDEGIGISAEALPHIFEMFTQGDSLFERLQVGLGVGLALAQRLVELHGGKLTAQSLGRGKGSSFTVVLPVMAALTASRELAATAAQPQAPQQSRRILLVDDNVDFAASLSLLLENSGHQVRTAHDADQALVMAREFRPEVGFLDLGLPKVSGYELARMLRQQSESAETVLIALSGWGQERDRLRSREAGFSLHLVKPVEFQSIEAVLSTLVRSR